MSIKQTYSLHLISYTFDHLVDARVFSKLDLRQGYYQIMIALSDEEKMTTTRYGNYEFLLILFSLTNAPSIFSTFINDLFIPFLDKYIVVYLDGIFLYNIDMVEHKEHL